MRLYRKVAIASTFSPTHRAVLAEAFAFLRRFEANVEILHCAERTEEKEQLFAESLGALGQNAEVQYLPGEDPVEAILRAVAGQHLDLVVAGALERHVSHEERSFTGSVARRLLERCPCDVLLLPNPRTEPPVLHRGFFAVEPQQEDVAEFVGRTSEILGLQEVILGVAETPFASAMAISRGEEPKNLERWADGLAAAIQRPGLSAEARVVDSNTGFGLCDAVRSSQAQILVVQAKRDGERTVFPSHLDWMRQLIPTRLLVSVISP